MPHVDTPWIGLVALVLMFALPFLPSWLFVRPRSIKHYPRRHVCSNCGATWTDGHICPAEVPEDALPLRIELRRAHASLRRVELRRPRGPEGALEGALLPHGKVQRGEVPQDAPVL